MRGEPNAGAALAQSLSALDVPTAIAVVRAFSYFSHAFNIAEDMHHNRRRRIYRMQGSAPQPGSIHAVLNDLTSRGVSAREILDLLNETLIAPVLTAHPTEVKRKTMLDWHRDLSELLIERDRMRMTPEEKAENPGLARARAAGAVADARDPRDQTDRA